MFLNYVCLPSSDKIPGKLLSRTIWSSPLTMAFIAFCHATVCEPYKLSQMALTIKKMCLVSARFVRLIISIYLFILQDYYMTEGNALSLGSIYQKNTQI